MAEERDAFVSLMDDIKIVKGKKVFYHGDVLDNKMIVGKLSGKDTVVVRSGVGKVYATMVAQEVIEKYKPEIVINVGCAGSLNENCHVGDVIVADRLADWDVEVPGWERSITSDAISHSCDERFISLAKKHKHVKVGNIVSGDSFIYRKAQVKTIKKYYPNALCCEMEGNAIATVCYAHNVKVAVIRSISDETLVNGSFNEFYFYLEKVCKNAAKLCKEIIARY